MIIQRIRQLVNDHPEDLGSCKQSSWGIGLLQMITHHPRHPYHLSQDPDSILKLLSFFAFWQDLIDPAVGFFLFCRGDMFLLRLALPMNSLHMLFMSMNVAEVLLVRCTTKLHKLQNYSGNRVDAPILEIGFASLHHQDLWESLVLLVGMHRLPLTF